MAAVSDVGIADAAAESRLAGAWQEFAESRTAVVAHVSRGGTGLMMETFAQASS